MTEHCVQRWQELAIQGAEQQHEDDALFEEGRGGHEGPFEACAHPDCKLVREASAPPAAEQVAWLVALGSSTPQWWTGRGDEWTANVDGTQRNPAHCAMRFTRREDAERAIGWLVKEGTRDGCKAEEHIWL